MINVFQLADNDQSVYYLGQIFGNMGIALAGTGSSLLPSMFRVFNSALLVVGTLMVAYVTIMGVLHTAAEGDFLGKKWGNIWLPLRMLLGVAALFPTGLGYCASQVVIMWFIVQGVGAADMVWKSAVEYLGSGGAVHSIAPSPSSIDVTGTLPKMLQTVFSNAVCQATVVKATAGPLVERAPSGDVNAMGRTSAIDSSNTYSFGRPNGPNAPNECGTLTLKGIPGKAGALEAQKQATATILPVLDILANYYAGLIIKEPSCWSSGSGGLDDQVPGKKCNPAQKDLFKSDFCAYFKQYNKMVTNCSLVSSASTDKTVSDIISQAGSNFMSDAAKLYYGYAQNYAIQETLRQNQENQKNTGTMVNLNDPFAAARSNGWIFAGAYYYYIAQNSNTPLENFAEFVSPQAMSYTTPKFTDTTVKDFVCNGCISYLDFAQSATTGAINVAIALSDAANQASKTGGGLAVKSGGGLPNEAAGLGPLADAAVAIAGSFIDAISPAKDQDPIIRLHEFGRSLLIDADIIFITFLLIGIGLGLLATYQIVFGNNLNPIAGISQFLQSYIIPLVYFFVGYLIVVGGLLGVYLPMLPYMLFTFGAIGWFIGVIEAMVAGPIVALGMLFPGGGESELLGKAAPSVMIVLNLFLRPTLMVFGMMAGMLMAIAVIQFVNTTFYTVMTNMGKLGIIEAFMFLMVYASLVITGLNKCYSLIYHLPARVLSWIGGQPVEYGEAQAAEAAKEKVGAGGAAVQKGQQGAVSGLGSVTGKALKAEMKDQAAAAKVGGAQPGAGAGGVRPKGKGG
jgi:defect in organelle trafficking protein DotA